MDCEDIPKMYVDKGSVTHEEGNLLFELARDSTKDGYILEIGTYKGMSSLYLGLGTKISKREKVYTIDKTDFTAEINSRLDVFELKEYVIPVVCSSFDASKLWNRPIRLLFIDGSHEYDDVLRDFTMFEPFVVKGGIIALHDTQQHVSPNGPYMLIENVILTKPEKFSIMREAGSIKAIVKLCD